MGSILAFAIELVTAASMGIVVTALSDSVVAGAVAALATLVAGVIGARRVKRLMQQTAAAAAPPSSASGADDSKALSP